MTQAGERSASPARVRAPHRRRKHGPGICLAAIAAPLAVALAIFGAYLALRGSLGLGGSGAFIDQYDGDAVRLAIGADLIPLSHPPIVRDNEISVDFDTVKARIDPKISWDAQSGKVTVTTRDRLIRMNTDSLTAFVNDKATTLDLPAFEESGVVYIPMKFLSGFYQIDVSYIDANRLVVIDDRAAVVQTAHVVADGAVIRLRRSRGSPIVKRYGPPADADADADGGVAGGGGSDAEGGGADAGAGAGAGAADASAAAGAGAAADMFVFEHYDGWYKVRSADGFIGFIEARFVAVRMFVDREAFADSGRAVWKPANGKISMVWEQASAASQPPSDIADMPGLDVVSPKWFAIEDGDGDISSTANAPHIGWAHSKGHRVWAMLCNDSLGIEKTSVFLNSQEARENAIRSILVYAAALGIDGINVDIENVYLSDRDALTQFIRELAPMLREQGLAVSMCVNVPDGSDTWSRCYDTPAIADAADYVMLMAYDQHVPSSANAGSASQFSWVESHVRRLVEFYRVPPEKMVLGVPFYSRVWEMEQGAALGGAFVHSSALFMGTAINNVWQYGATAVWDGDSGQFICEYGHSGKSFQMWLEDPSSVNLKLSLVHKYGLAGAAAWSREFAIPEVWDVFERNLKQIVTYAQWQSEASVESPQMTRLDV